MYLRPASELESAPVLPISRAPLHETGGASSANTRSRAWELPMPNDGARSPGNRPGRNDWRGGGSAARPRPGAKTPANKGHDWARHKTDDSAKLLWIFRAKIAAGVLLTIGLFVVLWYQLKPPKTTPFISFVISEYQYPVPPNAWAYDDVENIRELLSHEGENRTGGEPLAVTKERQIHWNAEKTVWLEKLRQEVHAAATSKWYQALGRGPGDGCVIIYLSGLGVVDDEGQACLLLPANSESDPIFDASRRMPIRELLDELFYDRDDKEERLPRDVLKLVILDASRIDEDWELGIPYNPFAASLRTLIETETPVTNLFVLNSADAGQKAWPSPELGGTVFGHFVRRGLQGHADGYAADATVRDPDRFVTVGELFEYVRRQTTRFVAAYRADEQRPILLRAANTDETAIDRQLLEYGESLRKVASPDSEAVATARQERLAAIGAKWAEIRQVGWDRYEELEANAVRYHPLAWQRFEHLLLRLERLAVAGNAETYQSQFKVDMDRVRALVNEFESGDIKLSPPNGLALAKALGTNPYADDTEALKAAAASFAADKPADPAKNPGAEQGSGTAETFATSSYQFKSQAAWNWIVNSPANAELETRIDRLHNALLPTASNWNMENEPVEIHFVRMLAAHRNRRERFDANQYHQAIARRAAAEQAAAPADPRVHYFSRTAASNGDEARRKADDALFVGRPADADVVSTAGKQATLAYERANRLAEVLADAYNLRDTALAEIPWLIRYHARRFETDKAFDKDDKTILTLSDWRHKLITRIDAFLKPPPVDGLYPETKVETFAKETQALRREFELHQTEVVGAMDKRSAAGDASDRVRLLDALAVPLLFGKARERLHNDAKATFGGAFNYDDLAPDRTEDASAAGRTDHHVTRMKNWLKNWKTHPALTLVDAPLTDNKEGDLVAVGAAMRKRLIEIEQLVASAKDVPGDLSLDLGVDAPSARSALAAADLTSRAAGLFRGVIPKFAPAERLERFDRQRMLVWHFQRALDDFWGPSPEHVETAPDDYDLPFFHVAAARFSALAARQDDGITAEFRNAPAQLDEMKSRLKRRFDAATDGLAPRFAADNLEIRLNPRDTSKKSAIHSVSIDRPADRDLPPGMAAYYLAEAGDAEARSATKRSNLAALSQPQVPTNDSRLPYDVAANRNPESRRLKDYEVLDPYGLYAHVHQLRGMVLYRGHRFRHPSQRVKLTLADCEREFEFKHKKPDPPAVTIAGAQKPRAVLLVVDCSRSMLDKDRMENARDAVNAAIAQLRAGSEPHRPAQVGLWLYGHRVQYENLADPNKDAPLVQSNFAKKFGVPPDVRPPGDVEERVPLGALTPEREAEITRYVREVAPYGNTSLYLAIRDAITLGFKDLKDPEKYERQILVLSDGADFIYTADKNLPDADKARVLVDHVGLKDILRKQAAASTGDLAPVRIDLIAYDFSATSEKSRDGWRIGDRAELDGIFKDGPEGVESDLGQIYDFASDPVDEIETQKNLALLIQRLLGVFRFNIVDERGNSVPITVERKSAGKSLYLNQRLVFGKPSGKFTVKFDGNVGGIAGGLPPEDFDFELSDRAENILLRIQENRRSGTLERWLQQEETTRDRRNYRATGREQQGKDLVDTKARSIMIYPRSPVPESGGIRFRVAIRYPDGKNNFTPQPIEALAVIQPDLDNIDPITIYDPTFEPGASVPELSFFVPNWVTKAGDASQAYVTVWFKFHQGTDGEKMRVGSEPKTLPVDGSPVTFTAVPDLDPRTGAVTVTVRERHVKSGAGRAPTIDRVKVSMEDQPARTHRCYITGGQEVVHTFEFPARAGLTLDMVRQYNVLLTRIDDMKRDAIHTHEEEEKAMLIAVPTNR
jgi:hypothetical protein